MAPRPKYLHPQPLCACGCGAHVAMYKRYRRDHYRRSPADIIGKVFPAGTVTGYANGDPQRPVVLGSCCNRKRVLKRKSLRTCRHRCSSCAQSARMHMDDLTGQTFGRLTVIAAESRQRWICECTCGQFTTVSTDKLKNGGITSCGCARFDGTLRWKHKKIEFRGESHWLAVWAREFGIPYNTAVQRFTRAGWTIEETLTTPVAHKRQPERRG